MGVSESLLARLSSPPEQDEVSTALAVVNDAANEARHRGDYGRANELVRARVVLSRAARGNAK